MSQVKDAVVSVLRLWFGFRERVGRKAYALTGISLMVVKYLGDRAIIEGLTSGTWTPLQFVTPSWSRFGGLDGTGQWLVVLAVWSIPFVWIGVSMSARRAIDAGISPGYALLFFLPLVNYLLMIILCLVKPKEIEPWYPPTAAERFRFDTAAGLAILAGFCIGLATLPVAVWLFGTYASGLFLGAPFAMGFVTAYLYDLERRHTQTASILVVQLGVLALGGFFLLTGIEGAICLAMAYGLAGPIALLGGLLGRAMTRRRGLATTHLALLAVVTPAMPLLDVSNPPPPTREVVTAIEIDAAPDEVWPHLVAFSELPEPSRWFFRLGIAYPRQARIEGHGVGAVRYCEFSTGPFVEPITRWDEPERLSFDVVAQPPTMHEWSPYRITPPHVTESFRSQRGEFRLVALDGGRTRLEGSTWYQFDLHPQVYWSLWSDGLLHAIHRRVLQHVKRQAERGGPR